jgi:hypothetical protein
MHTVIVSPYTIYIGLEDERTYDGLKLKLTLKALIAILFILLSSWSAVELYEITVNYGREAKAIINLVFEIQGLDLEDENTLEVSVKISNPSDEYIYITRLGVMLEKQGIYLSGLYKEYQPERLTLTPYSNVIENFRIVSRGLSMHLTSSRFTVHVNVVASTRYVKDIPLERRFEVELK